MDSPETGSNKKNTSSIVIFDGENKENKPTDVVGIPSLSTPPVISHPICRSIFGANEHQRQGNVRLVPAAESSAHPLLDRGPKTWRFDPGRHQSATPVLPLPAWLRSSSSSAVDDGKGGISEGGLVKSPFLVVHPHFCHKLNTAHSLVGKMIKM